MENPYRTLAHRLERLWWRNASPPLPLKAMSSIYAWFGQRDQRQRLAHQQTPPLPLISIGNITAGGSGKTPFVIWLADALISQGYGPVILCRGDGGSLRSPLLVGPDMPAQTAGDEARLLADACLCPVIAGRDRVSAAAMALQYGNVILLDDGFQYRQLARNLDIVLVPSVGVGNGRLIPAGPLREPLAAMERADLVVRTGLGPVAPLALAQRQWQWLTRIARLEDAMQTGAAEPKHVAAVSAIARPQRFHDDLARHGCLVDAVRVFPDHHRYSRRDIEQLLALPTPVVVTAKDAVKLAPLWPRGRALWIARQEAEAEKGLLEAIVARLPSVS
jgi:tetraacyldisaccharide 4'-kinase